MKIVTFATPKYLDLALECIESGAELGYDIILEVIEDTGCWLKNTAMKADIVWKHLNMLEPFIITDADSQIKREIDFSIFDGWTFAARVKNGTELLSGTMYFGVCQSNFSLVSNWKHKTKEAPRIIEQQHLHKALIESGIKFLRLPDKYCAIFDEVPKVDNPVIEHYQASRKFRRLLRG